MLFDILMLMLKVGWKDCCECFMNFYIYFILKKELFFFGWLKIKFCGMIMGWLFLNNRYWWFKSLFVGIEWWVVLFDG